MTTAKDQFSQNDNFLYKIEKIIFLKKDDVVFRFFLGHFRLKQGKTGV